MRLTYEQIERLYNDMIGGFVDLEETKSHEIDCIKVIPNNDLESIYYLNSNGENI